MNGSLRVKVYLRAANNIERQITDITDSFESNNETLVIQLTALNNSYQENFNKTKEIDNEIINLLKPEESEKNWRKLSQEDCFLLVFAKLDRALSKVPPQNHFLSYQLQNIQVKLEILQNLSKLNYLN